MDDRPLAAIGAGMLVQKFEAQLLVGCGNQGCDRKACYTYRKRSSKRPLRPMTVTTARAHALALASQAKCEQLLCSSDTGLNRQINNKQPDGDNASRPIDRASFEPNFINTTSMHDYFESLKVPSEEVTSATLGQEVTDSSSLPPCMPTLEPISAAKAWHFARTKTTVSDMFSKNVDISRQYEHTFFRTICFLRMREAVSLADFNHKTAKWATSRFLCQRDPTAEVERRRAMLGMVPPSDTASLLFNAVRRHLSLAVRRNRLLADAFNQLWHTERRLILLPIKTQIMSSGEVGQDYGGVTQEFFHLAIRDVFDPIYGLFIVDGASQMAWFDPRSQESLWRIEMLGLLMALGLHNGFTLPVKFPLFLYEKLQGVVAKSVSLNRIKDGWPDAHRTLEALLKNDDVEEWSMEYSIHIPTLDGRGLDVNMHDNPDSAPNILKELLSGHGPGIKNQITSPPLVNDSNKHQYVEDYISWLTDISVRDMLGAFTTGFHSCIPEPVLRSISATALKGLVEGEPNIDSDRLEASATYEGDYESKSPTIRDFWTVVHGFDDSHKIKLLEFVTARDRLPGTGSVRFIVDSIGGRDEKLPSSSTCDQRLFLPKYTNIDVMRKKLEYAIDNTQGFQIY